MNYKHLLFLPIISVALLTAACSNQTNDYSKDAELNSISDSVSYILGFQIGTRLSSQGFSDVDTDVYMSGLLTGLDEEESKIPESEFQALFADFTEFIQDRLRTKNKEEGEAFFAENREKEGVQETESGLQYKVLKEGMGKSPTPQDTVLVNYEGKLLDGTIFDTTYDSGQPAEFMLGGVIPGWIEGLQLMKEGAIYEFYIPSDLAYGEDPRFGGPIEPNATLIFKVELLSVK